MRIGGLGGGSGLCSGDGLFEDALLLGKILVGRLIEGNSSPISYGATASMTPSMAATEDLLHTAPVT